MVFWPFVVIYCIVQFNSVARIYVCGTLVVLRRGKSGLGDLSWRCHQTNPSPRPTPIITTTTTKFQIMERTVVASMDQYK